MESLKRVESLKKPNQCPTCGYFPLSDIAYGLIMIDDEVRLKLDTDEIVLGGCIITGDDPMWKCKKCGQKVYEKNNRYLELLRKLNKHPTDS